MDSDSFKKSISRVLPDGWIIAETLIDVLPDGHYWGMNYKGSKGVALILMGNNDVYLDWLDNGDVLNTSPVAKESICLWIMPSSYKLSWKRFFVVHRPQSAKLICSTPDIKVYGSVGHRVVDMAEFSEILSKSKETNWAKSPANNGKLSWRDWKSTIEKAFSR